MDFLKLDKNNIVDNDGTYQYLIGMPIYNLTLEKKKN